MFNKKKKTIESLKQNLKKVNENRLELRAENIAYQKSLLELSKKIDKIYDLLNPKLELKLGTEKISKVAMNNVKIAAKKLEEKKKEVKKNGK